MTSRTVLDDQIAAEHIRNAGAGCDERETHDSVGNACSVTYAIGNETRFCYFLLKYIQEKSCVV